jgi:hypothetical protein
MPSSIDVQNLGFVHQRLFVKCIGYEINFALARCGVSGNFLKNVEVNRCVQAVLG